MRMIWIIADFRINSYPDYPLVGYPVFSCFKPIVKTGVKATE